MKKLTSSVLLFVLALTSIAQSKKQSGYVCLRGGMAFKDDGVSNGTFGIGGGFGYISFDKPYIPLTVDISYFGRPGKVSPVIIGQAGYGVYNYSSAYVVGRGGFTGSISGGIGLPMRHKNKFIFTVGYYTYGFSTTSNVYSSSNSKTIDSRENRFAATFGFKF